MSRGKILSNGKTSPERNFPRKALDKAENVFHGDIKSPERDFTRGREKERRFTEIKGEKAIGIPRDRCVSVASVRNHLRIMRAILSRHCVIKD